MGPKRGSRESNGENMTPRTNLRLKRYMQQSPQDSNLRRLEKAVNQLGGGGLRSAVRLVTSAYKVSAPYTAHKWLRITIEMPELAGIWRVKSTLFYSISELKSVSSEPYLVPWMTSWNLNINRCKITKSPPSSTKHTTILGGSSFDLVTFPEIWEQPRGS